MKIFKSKGKLIDESQQDVEKIIEILYPKIREVLMQSYTKGFMKALSLSEDELKNYVDIINDEK